MRRIILAGTAPAGGEGIVNVSAVLQDAIAKAGAENKHPKHLLFFRPSKDSQKAADAFLSRLSENFSSLVPSIDAMLEQAPRSSQPAISAIGGLGASTTSVRKNAQYSPPAATQPSSKMRPHGTLPDLSA